ncbi:MFS transporter [Alicyclobacillus sp.]|uniref:MFS transporter n=1 Tax=Alicyclobacillus sp. TaxID=61169 RepID=UPI0025BCF29C|nr:MFS transporter [Alicyclobacillus sp.]
MFILWVSTFLAVSGTSLIIPFLPLFVQELGVRQLAAVEQWSGWIFAAQMLTAAIFQPIWGGVADRFGRKPMLLRAGIGMGTMTILMGFVTAPWQLLALRFINGVFAGFISMAISLQASVTPREYSGRALGTLQTGQVAGSLVGPLIGGALAEAVGFRWVFILTGMLLLLASLIVWIYVHEERAHTPNEARRRTPVSRRRVLTLLLPVFVASLITQLGMMSIQPILTVYTTLLYHGAHIELIAGLVVACTGIANLIGAPILGRFSDVIGPRKILVTALVCSALAFLPQVLATGIPMLLVGRFLLGLFIGGMLPSLNVLVKRLAPEEMQAQAYGVNSSFQFLGGLLGPLLGSTVAAVWDIHDVFYVTMALLLLNAVYIFFNRRLQVPAANAGEGRL